MAVHAPTERSAVDLASAIRSGETSSREVVEAHVERLRQAHARRRLRRLPAAVFNLAGVPVAQIPLGLNERGLPLGVHAAAGPGRYHVAVAAALELERALGGWVPPPLPADAAG